jgi:hypothetical protein
MVATRELTMRAPPAASQRATQVEGLVPADGLVGVMFVLLAARKP